MTRLTDEQLDELQRLHDEGTPGDILPLNVFGPGRRGPDACALFNVSYPNAALIVAARNALPDLLADRRELETEVQEGRKLRGKHATEYTEMLQSRGQWKRRAEAAEARIAVLEGEVHQIRNKANRLIEKERARVAELEQAVRDLLGGVFCTQQLQSLTIEPCGKCKAYRLIGKYAPEVEK